MAVRIRKINGTEYVYFVHWKDGRTSDVYCGAKSNPESEKKALRMEIESKRRRMDELNAELVELEARLEGGF